ncbi:hypothetical protein AWT69_001440 [Pseudomonas putida]|nr:hypothetical protein AWT69_001440 [Pseudomonas putida]
MQRQQEHAKHKKHGTTHTGQSRRSVRVCTVRGKRCYGVWGFDLVGAGLPREAIARRIPSRGKPAPTKGI